MAGVNSALEEYRHSLKKGRRRCHYCREERRGRTVDHIVPLARGGSNRKENLIPACGPCNQAKGNAMPTCECPRCVEAVRLWRLTHFPTDGR